MYYEIVLLLADNLVNWWKSENINRVKLTKQIVNKTHFNLKIKEHIKVPPLILSLRYHSRVQPENISFL